MASTFQERQPQHNQQLGELGLLNPDYPQDYIGQLAAPFKKDLDKPQNESLEKQN